MDSGIVEGFQNLHVLPDCEAVDSMTRELANLLDESSPRLHRKAHCRHGDVGSTAGCVTRHPLKKRRCKKRKSALMAGPVVVTNVSEGLDGGNTSDSSGGGGGTLTRHIFMDCVSRLSDSDGLTVSHRSGAIPPAVNTTIVESDSVTENWSPLRPQRRRRHLRRMAVDDLCNPCDDVSILRCLNSSQSTASRSSDHAHLLTGKRKRVVKDKSDNNSFDLDTINDDVVKMQESGPSSSVSSNESEVDANSTEDAADGDDEQSDFYAESDVSCARNPITRTMSHDVDSNSVDIDSLLSCNWDSMSPASQSHLKARFKLLSGRQYQAGRRRITDRARPPYLFSCFLEDRQQWDQARGPSATTWYQASASAASSTGRGATDSGGGGKRHRLMVNAEHLADVGCDLASAPVAESVYKQLTCGPTGVTLTDYNLRSSRRKPV